MLCFRCILLRHLGQMVYQLHFQKYWNIVWKDVKNMVLAILNNNQDSTKLNKTVITLISKSKNLMSPKGFRPISLCNMVMKMVTTLLEKAHLTSYTVCI